jgi:hypothetical protein
VSQSVAPVKLFAYDAIGNLLSKSGVGITPIRWRQALHSNCFGMRRQTERRALPSGTIGSISGAAIAATQSRWPPGYLQFDKGQVMHENVAVFLDSVKTGAPPAAAVPLLRAVWHGLRGEWDAARHIAQEDTSAESAWVHRWLHRIEGDLGNARYWYRQARRNVAEGDLSEEGKTIAAFLLNAGPHRTR